MIFVPTKTGIPVVDRVFRDLADALNNFAGGTGGSAFSITVGGGGGGSAPSGSSIINWGVETAVGAAGIIVTFTNAYSSSSSYSSAARGYTTTVGDVGIKIERVSASQMKLTPIGKTGVTIEWTAIGS